MLKAVILNLCIKIRRVLKIPLSRQQIRSIKSEFLWMGQRNKELSNVPQVIPMGNV